MLTFLFCVSSCFIGFMLGGVLVDGRCRRELAFKEKSIRTLREYVLEQDDENQVLKMKLEVWKTTAHQLENTLAVVSGTPKPDFGK